MDSLGIGKADLVGVSMGGMIAQWLAIDYPEKVHKLILVVTAPCPNESLTAFIMTMGPGSSPDPNIYYRT